MHPLPGSVLMSSEPPYSSLRLYIFFIPKSCSFAFRLNPIPLSLMLSSTSVLDLESVISVVVAFE